MSLGEELWHPWKWCLVVGCSVVGCKADSEGFRLSHPWNCGSEGGKPMWNCWGGCLDWFCGGGEDVGQLKESGVLVSADGR